MRSQQASRGLLWVAILLGLALFWAVVWRSFMG